MPQDERRIELLFSKQNANRIIICRNTVSQSVLTTNKDLKTTKTDASAHGIGHKIVESIVSGYHGSVDYFEGANTALTYLVRRKRNPVYSFP